MAAGTAAMKAAVLPLLKTRLKPLKSVVVRNGGAECASVARNAAVTPKIPTVGQMCLPLATSAGKSQISFWSARRFPGNSRTEMLRPMSEQQADARVLWFPDELGVESDWSC